MTGSPKLERRYRRVLACYPKAFQRESGRRSSRCRFTVFAGLLTAGLLIGFGEGGGEDALPSTWPDVTAAAVLWLVGLVAAVLIYSEAASPYYQRRAATRAATPANGTGR